MTYTAVITIDPSCLAGNHPDVAVAEDDTLPCGQRIASDRLALDPIELAVDVDDEDCDTKAIDEARTVLAANGWAITGQPVSVGVATYLPVERA